MQEELYYAIKEKEDKIHLGDSSMLLGRYQIITFGDPLDKSCFEPLQCNIFNIKNSRFYFSDTVGDKLILANGEERAVSPLEFKMRVYCFESIQYEGIMPDFAHIMELSRGFYFRYNKYYSPDVFYLSEVLRDDIPMISSYNLYNCIYSNKFDYVYKICDTEQDKKSITGSI